MIGRMDQAVLAAISGRFWQLVSGPITVLLIWKFFSQTEQGFFYAFAGYLGIQTFFELGLGGVLVSISGHEKAAAESKDQAVAQVARGRLADLIYKSVAIYLVAAVLFAIVAGWSGLLFFSRQESDLTWEGPWFFLVLIAAMNLAIVPLIAILEGTGHQVIVYRSRLGQAVFGSLAVWFSLSMGWGLWTAVVSASVQAIIQFYLILGQRGHYLRSLIQAKQRDLTIGWRTTVLPMQWRIAIQGIALYLATQAFTLVLMETQDPTIAGRWGMTWSILLALQSMGIVWLTAAFPKAIHLAAEERWNELDPFWFRTAIRSAILLISGIVGFAAVLGLCGYFQVGLESRFISPVDCLIFGIGMVAYHFSASLGYHVRAQRRESLYWAAVIGQSCVAVAGWYAAGLEGVRMLCITFAVVHCVVVLPLHWVAWRIDKKRFR